MVFPTLIFDLLPAGIRGLILVALIAAIMSSLDSTLNAVSTLVTMDFVKKLRPSMSNRRLVGIGRAAILLIFNIDLHFLYVAPILFVISVTLIIGVSLMTAPPSEEAQSLVWNRGMYRADTEALASVRWYANYRYQSVVLVIVTLIVVAMFI